MANEKIYTLDRFLGLNEAADSYSELKLGEASRIENFTITDGGNLSSRCGFSRLPILEDTQQIINMWSGYIREKAYLITVDLADGTDRITVTELTDNTFTVVLQETGRLSLTDAKSVVKIFPFGERVYIMAPTVDLCILADSAIRIEPQSPYIPTVINGADPQGGGNQFENINLLTSKRAVLFSCDGEATTYILPQEATAILSAETDSGTLEVTFSLEKHAAVFTSAPEKGVNNLRIVYDTDATAAAAHRKQVTSMPFWEAYNGTTDTRLFFYGDGSNVTLYTGVTDSGAPSALYVPAMNEIAVDFSPSPITGMIRLYNKLMVFKPDGASFITYEPVTLPGGDVIAGFYLRTASKSMGCDAPGQVQLVNNYPRTPSGAAVYEWRASSTTYNDERYAKRISERVVRTLSQADSRRMVTCDDNNDHTYYLFLGDENGTILVNRYGLDVWTVYRCPMAAAVRQAQATGGTFLFRTDTAIFYLDESSHYDFDGTTKHTIEAVWESGYMSFGANFRRKFSSYLWLTVKPESGSAVTVTAASDRKSIYAEKTVRSDIFNYGNISYASWSYHVASLLKAHRLKLKVKKVTFYKLIFKVTEPGARGTILRCDQQVRFSSLVK